jgi:hypothetical protein
MRWKHLSAVMAVPGLEPGIVAAMTLNNWFNMTGTRSPATEGGFLKGKRQTSPPRFGCSFELHPLR